MGVGRQNGMMRYGRWVLLGAHLCVAVLAVSLTWTHFAARHLQVTELGATAQREAEQLTSLKTLVGEQRALLAGLRVDDPYVIELLARQRYHYRVLILAGWKSPHRHVLVRQQRAPYLRV